MEHVAWQLWVREDVASEDNDILLCGSMSRGEVMFRAMCWQAAQRALGKDGDGWIIIRSTITTVTVVDQVGWEAHTSGA